MLLRAPGGWPQPVVATVAMVLLALLDLGGSFAAKEAVERRSAGLAVLGAGLFLAVFWVYISSLEVAELSAVTFGWIVILQVGVVLLDRFRYGVLMAPGAWLAIAILLAAQAYLLLTPGAVRASAPPASSALSASTLSAPDVSVPAVSAQVHSTQGGDQDVEAVQNDLTELGGAERADPDSADQECLADGFLTGVRHVSPQRQYEPGSSLTTQG
jgi:hypothetical protein